MIAFIDTSSLIKRYIKEENSEKLLAYMSGLSGVIVAPVTLIELYSGLTRRLDDRSLTSKNYQEIEAEVLRNFQHFHVVQWNDELMMEAVTLVKRYKLRALDAIQLAGAKLAGAQELVASDMVLAAAARKEIKTVRVI